MRDSWPVTGPLGMTAIQIIAKGSISPVSLTYGIAVTYSPVADGK